MKRMQRNKRKGAALVEYAFLIAGIALIAAASVATFGHKTNDMIAAVAAVVPGAHADDNSPIISGRIIETSNKGPGKDSGGTDKAGITLDVTTIVANSDGTKVRLGSNLGTVGSVGDLVLEPK